MKFVPLHVHSEYSLLDGLSKTSQISKRIAETETEVCALTDHGTVSGAVDFYQTLKASSQKPILGCELYICKNGKATDRHPDNKELLHQVVLAKNFEGWKDLLSLVSLSNHPDQFYYKPRIDFDQLASVANRGNLISFSGHLGSHLANCILEDRDAAYEAQRLKEMFGSDNFYVEIQLIDAEKNETSRIVAEQLREVSRKANLRVVATPDAHYPTQDDAEDQRVLLCTAFKKTIGQVQREIKGGKGKSLTPFFSSNNFYIPSYEDMKRWHTDEEIANTVKIASDCEDYDILSHPNPPAFPCPSSMSDAEYLKALCRHGWKEKMGHINKTHPDFLEYGKRIDNELNIFRGADLSGYFLIVQDILKFCQADGYLIGPGRGSAAGCMVSYLVGITQIDPVKHDLVFERFYNAGRNTDERISMPDIDIDVPKEARAKIIEYIKQKYGDSNVAQIISFQTLKGRASLKRVMQSRGNISFDEQNAITQFIMDESKIADELQDMKEELGESSIVLWALKNKREQLKEWCEIGEDGKLEGRMAKVFEQAIRLEDTKIIQSKHAAGVVVSPRPISETCPMIHSSDKEDKSRLAGFEGPSCEEVGLLKLDVLGIRMLDKIMEVPDILRQGV
jgi:DNA polymerase-3 subunit alpha